jgi:hypothetical protein
VSIHSINDQNKIFVSSEGNHASGVWYNLQEVKNQKGHNFVCENNPNVGKPVCISHHVNGETYILIVQSVLHMDENEPNVKISSSLIKREINGCYTFVRNIGKPIKIGNKKNIEKIQLSATENNIFFYLSDESLISRLYFLSHTTMIDNNHLCWFPVELDTDFYFANLLQHGVLIGACHYHLKGTDVACRSLLLLNGCVRVSNRKIVGPYRLKMQDQTYGTNIEVKRKSSTQVDTNEQNTVIIQCNPTPEYNVDGEKRLINTKMKYRISNTPSDNVELQGKSNATDEWTDVEKTDLASMEFYLPTDRLELPKAIKILKSHAPPGGDVLAVYINLHYFLIIKHPRICEILKMDKNGNYTSIHEPSIEHDILAHTHSAGPDLVDMMALSDGTFCALFSSGQNTSTDFKTFTMIQYSWKTDKKKIGAVKSITVRNDTFSYAKLQHHENRLFSPPKIEVCCIAIYKNNFESMTCSCTGDGKNQNKQREVPFFTNYLDFMHWRQTVQPSSNKNGEDIFEDCVNYKRLSSVPF